MQLNPEALAAHLETLRIMYTQVLTRNRDLEAELDRVNAQRDRLIAERCTRRGKLSGFPPRPIAGATWN